MTYMPKLSVVVDTYNKAKDLEGCLKSVQGLADEIVVCDEGSSDSSVEIAKRFGAKVISHKREDYVELLRNFEVSKASGDWILVLDPDEEVSAKLAKKIKEILKKPTADYYRLPRKNIVFGKWIRHTRWWPDYNIRLFKKGFVSWSEQIHAVPITQGVGADLPAKEEYSVTHHNYDSIESYLERMTRYTRVQSEGLMKNGYVLKWQDVIHKPTGEFLSRFFAGEGYKDGLHGLALSFLQAFSELVIYLRIWEKQGFKEESFKESQIKKELNKALKDFGWWIGKKLSWLKFLR